ncbi:hypothetical protein MTR_4g077763 [Medicago truncatula]|uniref:Uncharacterized protein n=1 Tax=Medicago truncatula TaxID=3880 RepID=A0A072UNM2_MEDTR|nr:hypothetical protein MTR_4g077763 [Medicago truncatula]
MGSTWMTLGVPMSCDVEKYGQSKLDQNCTFSNGSSITGRKEYVVRIIDQIEDSEITGGGERPRKTIRKII